MNSGFEIAIAMLLNLMETVVSATVIVVDSVKQPLSLIMVAIVEMVHLLVVVS